MARPEGESERTSQQSQPTEQHKPHQERGNGPLGIQPTPESHEPQKEPIPLLDPVTRILRKAVEREYSNPEDRLQKIQRLLVTLHPREAEVLRRRFGIPSEQLSPDAEAILRIFGPSHDKPSNDDKR